MLALTASLLCGETFPRLSTQTLNDTWVRLPDDAQGKVALLIVGFSHGSSENTAAWRDRFIRDFGKDPKFTYYEVAILEGMPSFVRNSVLNGMRKNTPIDRIDHFVITLKDGHDWKKVTDYHASGDAYLVLLDPNGEIKWRGHRPLNDADYQAMVKVARGLTPAE